MLESIKHIVIFFSLSYSTMIFYKTTRTYQLAITTISALCVLLIYPVSFARLSILVPSIIVFVFLYSWLFYRINQKSLHYKFDFDISIIEIAIYSILTYTLFIFYSRGQLDKYKIENFSEVSLITLIIIILFLLFSILFFKKNSVLSKIKLWSDNQTYYQTIFTSKSTRRLFISLNILGSIVFILAILLYSFENGTSYKNILEYYIYGLSIWFICGDRISMLLLCSILLTLFKYEILVDVKWNEETINEDWIFVILLTAGIIINTLNKKNVRLFSTRRFNS